MRKGDAGVSERLLLVARDVEDVAEGGDLDGPAYAGAPQRLRDAQAEAARLEVRRELAHHQVPPHRHFHRLGLLPLILLLQLLLLVVALRAAAVPGRGLVEGQPAGEDAVVGGLDAEEEADAGGQHGGGGESSQRRRDAEG